MAVNEIAGYGCGALVPDLDRPPHRHIHAAARSMTESTWVHRAGHHSRIATWAAAFGVK